MKASVSADEKRAIASLNRVAKKWPKSLWLFSASGTLWVMKCGADGKPVMTPTRIGDGGTDPAYCITKIDIPNDGGDW